MINSIHQQTEQQVNIVSFHIIVSGFVQGVGFRPFIFRLANELAIKGYVSNNTGLVTIVAEGNKDSLKIFCERLLKQAPANAKPVIQSINETAPACYDNFSIRQSNELNTSDIHILPDLPTCDQCLEELFNQNNRRYLYPFINCTQCGPRNSIITSLPYDRKNTSMQPFKLCSDCEEEYLTPNDRRFHAEPVACENCGPVLNFVDDTHDIYDNALALEASLTALKQGKIIAVKGISGYHLMCDATSTKAIALLRNRKHRPDKPFAVLMQSSQVNHYVAATEQELALLQQHSRPIVLIKNKNSGESSDKLPDNLAPGTNRLGIMLASNPLQHLLCHFFQKPLVATSANLSGEPIITGNMDATKRLQNLCDAFLHNNRVIVRPADDPVMLQNNFNPQILRTGRGIAPTEFTLPFTLERPILAVGGHIKNTIALAWKNRMVISANNNDLGNLRSYRTFQQGINDLQQLYQMKAEHIICDAHSGYASTQWASQTGLPVSKIFHHHAHASSLTLESIQNNKQHNYNWLIFSWDGIGLGVDDSLWGGETFLGHPGNWQRVASFKSFRLPGGDKTSREAWRVAASLCWHTGIEFDENKKHSRQLNTNQLKIIWQRNMNCPESSAAGRLFSAAASLLGLVEHESFEGHGPMLLEALAETTQQEMNPASAITLPMTKDDNGIIRINWQPLVIILKDKSLDTTYRARCFHETLAECISKISVQYNDQFSGLTIGLSGGVFQNQLLVRLIKQRLDKHNINFIIPSSIPVNDGGLCAGQIIEYHYQ